MAKRKLPIKNIFFLAVIALLIIPQTRHEIQIVLQTVLAKLSPSIEKEDTIKQVSSYNWKLQDLDGNSFELNKAKGKITFINIWATWCPPCIAEMPSIEALYKDYNDKIEFVMVSNEKQEVVKTFLKQKNYNFNTYLPLTQAPETFSVNSIPRTFLLDKQGNIIIDKSGAANWNSEIVRKTIDKLLK